MKVISNTDQHVFPQSPEKLTPTSSLPRLAHHSQVDDSQMPAIDPKAFQNIDAHLDRMDQSGSTDALESKASAEVEAPNA